MPCALFRGLARLLSGGPVVARLALLVLPALPLSAAAATIIVGPERQPAAFAEAAEKAADGDEIVLLAGTYKGVSAVIEHKKLTIRGEGKTRPVILFDGKLAAGRALFVVKGGDVRLENLEFRGARATDGDGAGVRFEAGRLTIVRCAFFDNEHGLVTGNARDAELTVQTSEFAHAPRDVGRLNHLVHVGPIAQFTLSGSRLFNGFEGHLVKSRARQTRLLYNMIRDGASGEASHEVDLPSGGRVTMIGNVVGQSPRSQNPVVISYGSEGKTWDDNTLVLSHNTLISEGWLPAWFLRVHRDRVPGMGEVLALNNLVVGSGLFELGALGSGGQFTGNRPATLGMLADVVTGGFELPPDSWWRGLVPDPRRAFGRRDDLAPQAEFEWPLGLRTISTDRVRWAPGAYQR